MGLSPPVGVRGSGIVERRAAFTVGLIDARTSRHQRDCTLVAAVGGCVVQWGPVEKAGKVGERAEGRPKGNQRSSLQLLCSTLPT